MSEDRAATGIESFDDLIEGGIPKGSLVLLAGDAGSGKSVFAAQYLYHGVSRLNEPGIYVSLAEERETFLRNMKRMGMDFEKLEQEGKFVFLDCATVTEKGVSEILTNILEEIASLKAKRLVIDSFTAMSQAFKEPIDTRTVAHTILSKMVRQTGCTTLLVTEKKRGEEQIGIGIEEFVADGVLLLNLSTEKGYLERRLQIIKMRGTKTSKEGLRYDINERGIAIYRALQTKPIEKPFTGKVSTGIEGLDKMLGGGLTRASTTMVSGASGTGKSTTALSFIVQGAKQNERGLYFSFEEPAAKLIEHGEAFGWQMKEFVAKGLIKIVHVDVEPHNIDQQFSEIGRLLAEYEPARFVMDSVTPFEKTMSDEEFVEHMKRWAYYNAANGMTLLFTVTSEPTASMTGTGVSSFVDNIISLRDVELESALRRSMIIFKARGRAHDRDIREFEITSKGMIVKEKFVGVEQILGGAARRSMTNEAAENLARAFGKK